MASFNRLLSFFASNYSLSTTATESGEPLPPPINFDIDQITGFIPSRPLPRLCGEYKVWEDALAEAPEVLKLGDDFSDEALALKAKGEKWRSDLRATPVIGVQNLITQQPLLQRAHLVLAWLVHYYVHSLPPNTEPNRVSPSLAVPLVEVSRAIGIAPVITYSDTVMWNWELINAGKPVTIDNMIIAHNFSARDDERHFYQVHAAIELHGVQALHIIDSYYHQISESELDLDEPSSSILKIKESLSCLAIIIEEISDLIQSIRAGCDPRVFYREMRPWFNGNDAKGSDDPGWIYEGVDPGAPELVHLSGPSGGQSPQPRQKNPNLRVPSPLNSSSSTAPKTKTGHPNSRFMDEMRNYYIPKNHRVYLDHIKNSPRPIRELAKTISVLRGPYNDAVAALKKLRGLHMRIVLTYIIKMAREEAPRHGTTTSRGDKDVALDREDSEPARGTARGTDLILLLKGAVDSTSRAALHTL
ncbi:hypothetical protein D9757_011903 [Collybiopsis confluens]|uniref:Indoleamine 2,3-dioxygenase n=1 Tax=Collybiopsis confluens TaxID=2823264 RepID=A0A8H5LNR4_9AGAR|nr:hypothetical protein D9757_011903 [Collybiopsis confluens]